ncbi:hypothetical protein C4565_03360 [Candidatus Parcubacteria bacterium]|jgi:MFS family permease|nr:MAG: hypothetical protein C4565_03360 [Candidatus Parcubacteria bacterium]
MRLDWNHHFHLRLFDTRELGALSIMLAIIYFGEGLVNIFVPIYFWKLGFPIWKILGFYLLNSVYFLIFAGLLIPVIKRMSDKFMIALSVPFLIVYFLLLNSIDAHNYLFWIAPALLALNMLFLNVGYTVDFTYAIRKGREGHEVGMRYLTGALSQFLAPLFGGFIIAIFGFHISFFVAIAIFFISVIPLFFVPRREVGNQIHIRGLFLFFEEKYRAFNIASMGVASELMVGRVLWPIFMFLALQSFEELGGIVSLGMLLGALGTYIVGSFFDKGRARGTLISLSSIFSLVWFSRVFLRGVNLISGSHIVGNIVNSGLMVAWASEYYSRARDSESPIMFVLSREILYQVVRIFFLPVLMVLSLFIPLEFFFPICFAIAGFLTILFSFAAEKKI